MSDVTTHDDGTLTFDCPRCGLSTLEQFYGPCTNCCDTLHAQYADLGRAVEEAEYVPKMNVTPNAVALKDD